MATIKELPILTNEPWSESYSDDYHHAKTDAERRHILISANGVDRAHWPEVERLFCAKENRRPKKQANWNRRNFIVAILSIAIPSVIALLIFFLGRIL